MEGIVNSQVVNHLERNRLLPDSQYGFRRGRGTADVLTALQNEWVQVVANGGSAQVIAVDIAGAFDRVSHTGLLYKAERADIRGTLLTWLQDYLHSGQLKVVVSSQASSAQYHRGSTSGKYPRADFISYLRQRHRPMSYPQNAP